MPDQDYPHPVDIFSIILGKDRGSYPAQSIKLITLDESPHSDLNRGPIAYKASALAELSYKGMFYLVKQ